MRTYPTPASTPETWRKKLKNLSLLYLSLYPHFFFSNFLTEKHLLKPLYKRCQNPFQMLQPAKYWAIREHPKEGNEDGEQSGGEAILAVAEVT